MRYPYPNDCPLRERKFEKRKKVIEYDIENTEKNYCSKVNYITKTIDQKQQQALLSYTTAVSTRNTWLIPHSHMCNTFRYWASFMLYDGFHL